MRCIDASVRLLRMLLLSTLMLMENGAATEPRLYPTGTMHRGTIHEVATSRSAPLTATVGTDRTCKLWDSRTGGLIRTLYPPWEDEGHGALYACALSGDGLLVAVGGATGLQWGRQYCVYVFSVKSGLIEQCLDGLTAPVADCAFSIDGRYLAVALFDGAGVVVFETGSWTPVQTLPHGRTVRDCEFDSQGRLATVSADRQIRIFSRRFRLVGSVRTPASPFSLSFSPDDARIAVGMESHTAIRIVRADNLNVLTDLSFHKSHPSRGTWFAAVEWTPAGDLWSAVSDLRCTSSSGGQSARLLRWREGRVVEERFLALRAVVLDLQALGDSAVVGAGTGPYLAAWEPRRETRFEHRSSHPDFRSSVCPHFHLDTKGTSLIVGGFGDSAAYFTLPQHLLSHFPPPYPSACIEAFDITVTGWRDGNRPRINGKILHDFGPSERSRSVAVDRRSGMVMIGAQRSLSCFSRKGELQWKRGVAEPVWRIALAGGRPVCAVALGDGTVRWYRIDSGEELLGLSVDSRFNQWIAWAPGGLWDGSAGGSDQLSWIVNRGPGRAASAFPPERRPNPDGIAATATSKHFGVPERYLEHLPPFVRIVSPVSGTTVHDSLVILSVQVRTSRSAPLEDLSVQLREIPGTRLSRGMRVLHPEAHRRRLPIALHPGANIVTVHARNRHGPAEPASLVLHYAPVADSSRSDRSDLYVLSAGISEYRTFRPKLRFAAKDAHDVASIMDAQRSRGVYGRAEVATCTDSDATKSRVLSHLDHIAAKSTARDVVIIFLAGHGVFDRQGRAYFLPFDASPDDIETTGIEYGRLMNALKSIHGKVLLLLDACFSGAVLSSVESTVLARGSLQQATRQGDDMVVFCSSTIAQHSTEDPSWRNGAFTKALLEGLRGAADYAGDGMVTASRLGAYLSHRIATLTAGRQTPVAFKPGRMEDFVVVLTPARRKSVP